MKRFVPEEINGKVVMDEIKLTPEQVNEVLLSHPSIFRSRPTGNYSKSQYIRFNKTTQTRKTDSWGATCEKVIDDINLGIHLADQTPYASEEYGIQEKSKSEFDNGEVIDIKAEEVNAKLICQDTK